MEELDCMPMSASPEWQDVQPLEVDDGRKVVAIQYTSKHREAMAYFRAILEKGEKSARALALTEEMISLNQADYTAWQWRWACLCALGSDITQEYAFTDAIMQSNAKNYQLWNHRRKCALALGAGAAERELSVAGQALDEDEKNYHAWAHRQAIVKAFGGHLWASELAYAQDMVSRDVRNNSAWNQRAFLLRHKLEAEMGEWNVLSPEQQRQQAHPLSAMLAAELEYVAAQVAIAPRNESAWNYLHGLFRLPGTHPHDMARFQEVYAICAEALRSCPNSAPALDALSLYYVHLAHLAAKQMTTSDASGGDGVSNVGGSGALSAHSAPAQHGPAGFQASGSENMEGGGAASMQAQQNQASSAVGNGAVASASSVAGGTGAAAAARLAILRSAQSAVALLNHLMVADPIRSMYWNHRWQEIEALCLRTGIQVEEVLG
eukprot:CAMPEP_0202349154 /NCGR_PEP_ID=MMETSP1126-20121109/6769_1 /ASSEMBLY_ACC=CAM_ASM_000457 /TAXON_ID=3047 /ORGANISM="Dunaliella tertiolecta, Strain CCMP1320" /LENGTH=434 /DNA_ID=CAMNT_0048940927 /DNA_START=774 /DNA_END=2078 /DNA_ORIENTATION=-